jgi:hypothetical protein
MCATNTHSNSAVSNPCLDLASYPRSLCKLLLVPKKTKVLLKHLNAAWTANAHEAKN